MVATYMVYASYRICLHRVAKAPPDSLRCDMMGTRLYFYVNMPGGVVLQIIQQRHYFMRPQGCSDVLSAVLAFALKNTFPLHQKIFVYEFH